MSRRVSNRLKETDIWCGYDLTGLEKQVLTHLSMVEMCKPISQRLKYYKLVELAKFTVSEIEFNNRRVHSESNGKVKTFKLKNDEPDSDNK